MSNKEEMYSPDLLTLIDEDNQEHSFEELDRIELEGRGRYVALLEVFDDPKDYVDFDGELLILKVVEEDGEDVLITIDDDEELHEVFPLFEERLSDMFEIEE